MFYKGAESGAANDTCTGCALTDRVPSHHPAVPRLSQGRVDRPGDHQARQGNRPGAGTIQEAQPGQQETGLGTSLPTGKLRAGQCDPVPAAVSPPSPWACGVGSGPGCAIGQLRPNSALRVLSLCSTKTYRLPDPSSQAFEDYFLKSQTSKETFTSDSPTGLLMIQAEYWLVGDLLGKQPNRKTTSAVQLMHRVILNGTRRIWMSC